MKSISKKITRLITISAVTVSLFAIANEAVAQAKPAGKPWPTPESAIKMKNPVKADETSIKEGKDLYNQHCKSCHGTKGKGDGSKAEKIDISCGDFSSADYAKVTDGEAYWKTTEGRKPMPSFKEKLTDKERWAIVNYIRTLGVSK